MEEEAIAERLRCATEDDVAAALKGSYVEEIGAVGHDKLLEFFNLMVGQVLGGEHDGDTFVRIPRME